MIDKSRDIQIINEQFYLQPDFIVARENNVLLTNSQKTQSYQTPKEEKRKSYRVFHKRHKFLITSRETLKTKN